MVVPVRILNAFASVLQQRESEREEVARRGKPDLGMQISACAFAHLRLSTSHTETRLRLTPSIMRTDETAPRALSAVCRLPVAGR